MAVVLFHWRHTYLGCISSDLDLTKPWISFWRPRNPKAVLKERRVSTGLAWQRGMGELNSVEYMKGFDHAAWVCLQIFECLTAPDSAHPESCYEKCSYGWGICGGKTLPLTHWYAWGMWRHHSSFLGVSDCSDFIMKSSRSLPKCYETRHH